MRDAIDIREGFGIEIEFDVLQSGFTLMPHFYLWNEEGIRILGAFDLDPEWRRRKRPEGHYVSTGWIPGNLLAEGTVFVDVAVIVVDPFIPQVFESSVIAFQVVGTMDGDTSRGDWAGATPGVVRPLLDWTTDFTPADSQCV